jgi:hypothetical protein
MLARHVLADQQQQKERDGAAGASASSSSSNGSSSSSALDTEELEHARDMLLSIDMLAQQLRPHVHDLYGIFNHTMNVVENVMATWPPTSQAGFVRVPWEATAHLSPEDRHRVTGDSGGAASVAQRAHRLCAQGRVAAAVTLLVEATSEALPSFRAADR